MALCLKNGTAAKLTGLRVQNCVMLKGASGFNRQTSTNKVFIKPYAAVRSSEGNRWIITAWEPSNQIWGNEQVPCIHSDPKFPDCEPGQMVQLRGWLSFYDGADIKAEVKRIEQTGWQKEEIFSEP
jgi:hypothetical protein